MPHSSSDGVEWLYSWDVHCNGFVSVLLIVYVGQYMLLPVIAREGLVPCLIGNSLYLAAGTLYWYNTFNGYLVLPFLQKQNVFLLPILGLAVLLLLPALLFQWNVAQWVLGIYFA